MTSGGEVTQLLRQMRRGNRAAAEQVLPMLYSELHRLAEGYMRRERPDHTLQATALIHEAYLRLAGEEIEWQDRAHYIGFAAHVMRQVLVDHARARQTERRAGRLRKVELREELAISPERLDEVVSVDSALNRLAADNERQARVVELRYFGGLTVEQIAEVLAIAPRSVKRDWSLARMRLARELGWSTGATATRK